MSDLTNRKDTFFSAVQKLQFIKCLGDRMWSFAIGIYLVELQSQRSLKLPAIYGFINCAAVMLCGPALGAWVDRTQRIQAAVQSQVIQCVMVIICSAILSIHFHPVVSLWSDWSGPLLQAGVILTAVSAQLSSKAAIIAVTKDWVKVVAASDNQYLAMMNASIRRIDLISSFLAPLLVSQLMGVSRLASSLFLTFWNLLSLLTTYRLLWSAYTSAPTLQIPKVKKVELGDGSLKSLATGWRTYFQQETLPAGIGLALLYMTVLGFDGITIGYVFIQGVSETAMGFLPALAGLVGILGTLAYPRLHHKIGLNKTGLLGFGTEVVCLSLSVASLWAPGSTFSFHFNDGEHSNPELRSEVAAILISPGEPSESNRDWSSVSMLLTGIILARFGLWIADLTVHQCLQEFVPPGDLGAVSGVQQSLNSGLSLVKFGLVVLFPQPQTFGYLVLVSFGFVCTGWAGFAIFAKQKRRKIPQIIRHS